MTHKARIYVKSIRQVCRKREVPDIENEVKFRLQKSIVACENSWLVTSVKMVNHYSTPLSYSEIRDGGAQFWPSFLVQFEWDGTAAESDLLAFADALGNEWHTEVMIQLQPLQTHQ